ncbi:MAG: S1C family serine protease, partial [Acidimicrobiales bacterium]
FFAVTAMTVALSVVAGIGLGYAVWSPAASPAQNALSHNGAANGGSGSQSDPGGLFPNGSGSGSSGSGSSGSGNPAATTAIAAKVDPALVDINVVLSYQDESAAGTGQVLTSSGLVLTNNHVVDEATSISATDIGNGKTYSASVVGYDRTGDLAVIQLHNASGLSTVTIGDSSKVSVGQSIVAIGNAGGVGGTPSVAAGSVTTLNQAITASDDDGGNAEQLTGLIEVNADVQPGDSGGPLVNSSGDVVGIDTAAAETSFSDSTGDGYAIPINTAISVAKEIEAGKGSSTIHIGPTAFLGVGISSGSSSFGGLGGNLGGSTVDGADVQSVAPGSPAEQAGLAVGDVITSVAGQAVTSSASLSTIIGSHVPGDSVVVQWEDAEGNSHSATVQLASGPAT